MFDESEHPIAYTALKSGTPVPTSDGYQFAAVQAMLVDEKVSVFDGVVVQTAEGPRFVDADQIDSIYTSHVRTTLSAEQAANLPVPDGSALVEIKPAKSMADRLAGFSVGGSGSTCAPATDNHPQHGITSMRGRRQAAVRPQPIDVGEGRNSV